MQPGLSRAIPLGILGFIVGTVILMVIRTLQSLQPALDPQLAIVLGGFVSAGFFVWGMGAFDPRMNVHAHEPSEDDEHHEIVPHEDVVVEEKPTQILGGYLWVLATLLLVLFLVIGAFAMLPQGPSLQTVGGAAGNVANIGDAQIPLDSQTFFGLVELDSGPVAVSKLAVLIGFIVFMFVSLAVFAGGIGFLMFALSRGATTARAVPATVMGPGVLAENPTPVKRLTFIALFIVVFIVLTLLFYYVLIGLVLPTASFLLPLSIVNALIFTILILRPKAVARVVGRGAGWLAKQLRRLPNALQ
jgi:hypothetical protein